MRKALQIAGMSLSALFGNWARSVLTTLGVVIGVAAVILIMSLGNGVQSQVTGQLDELGPNLMMIAPGSGGASQAGAGPGGDGDGGPGGGAAAVSTLTTKDATAVAKLPSVTAASPNVSVTVPVKGSGYQFSGVASSYQKVNSVKLQAGHFVKSDKELVLTTAAAKDLLNSGPKAAIGQNGLPQGQRIHSGRHLQRVDRRRLRGPARVLLHERRRRPGTLRDAERQPDNGPCKQPRRRGRDGQRRLG